MATRRRLPQRLITHVLTVLLVTALLPIVLPGVRAGGATPGLTPRMNTTPPTGGIADSLPTSALGSTHTGPGIHTEIVGNVRVQVLSA